VHLRIFDPRGVGAFASAHVPHDGHSGVDSNPSKKQLNVGHALLVEPGLHEPADAALGGGRLSATTDRREAVYKSGFSIICGKGAKSEPDLSSVTWISRQIVGAAGCKTPMELKPSRSWQGQIIFCQLCGRHWPARSHQSPVGSDTPRPVRQLLKRLVAGREVRIQGWNRVSDATASNSGPRPIRTIRRLASNRNHGQPSSE
jgi:hypothetical protein